MTVTVSSVLTDSLAAAVRAPSPHNTQPWRFEVLDSRIDLLLDRTRVLAVADPDAREARLSCGAALCNLRLALRAHGRAVFVDLRPDRDQPDLLAVVRIGGERAATSTERRLAQAIARRHTNRHPFLERPVPPQARQVLRTAARDEGGWLEIIDASERYDLIANLVRRAEHIQQTDDLFQREFRLWTGGPIDRTDGVPIDAVGPDPESDRALAPRTFYRPSPEHARQFEQQPLLAAVLTQAKGPRYDVRAGAAMQRVLLAACDLGLSASFLSQPFEVPQSRDELTAAFRSAGEIHTLLRIGYGDPGAPTPRRPIDEVTVDRERSPE